MFTGIVEEIGEVVELTEPTDRDARLVVRARKASDTTPGASVAVNGVCLTVLDDAPGSNPVATELLSFDVMPQTLKLTGLGNLEPGDHVNLERAMLATSRFDGHVVQGHVDGRATLVSRDPGPRWDALKFALDPALLRFVAPQGSITVDGVSLTITDVDDQGFGVALIPTTLAHTTLGKLEVGSSVNIEVDALAKYAAHLAKTTSPSVATADALNSPDMGAASEHFFGKANLTKIAEADLPTAWGSFRIHAYRGANGVEHVALVKYLPEHDAAAAKPEPPLVRVHSECLTGDAFSSLRCDCGPQLHFAMEQVAKHGGAVVYLRNQEGRGIGIAAKIAAYALQDEGLDTVEANQHLGLPVDARDYTDAVEMLQQLGLNRIRLLTNNPAKVDALSSHGIDIAQRVPIEVGVSPINEFYLQTKRDSMGHYLQL